MARTTRLLDCEVDDATESYFRVLHDGTVRYFTVAPGIFTIDDMTFAPQLFAVLPPFPVGDWTSAKISIGEDGRPCFEQALKTTFRGVENRWHPRAIDHLSFITSEIMEPGLHEVTSPEFEGKAVIKYARFEWEIGYFEKETAAYQMVEGKGLTPRFIGHLMEHGRVIGIVVEKVANARHATTNDYELCYRALKRFHDHGFLHGDINKHNFLIVDGRVITIDLETVERCDDSGLFEKELQKLRPALEDESGKGGRRIITASEDV